MKKDKLFCTFTILIISLLLISFSATYYATEPSESTNLHNNSNVQDIFQNNRDENLLDISTNGLVDDVHSRLVEDVNSRDLGELPSSFDPRLNSQITDIRNQQYTVTCWMHAAIASVEQNAVKFFGSKFNISEAHGVVSQSISINPALYFENYPANNSSYYNCTADSKGNNAVALQYLTNWNVPIFNDNNTKRWNSTVLETNYPLSKIYQNHNHNSTNDLQDQDILVDNDFLDSDSILNVTEAKYIAKNISSIKQAVYNYGAVTAGIEILNSGYSTYNHSYFFLKTTGLQIMLLPSLAGMIIIQKRILLFNPLVTVRG